MSRLRPSFALAVIVCAVLGASLCLADPPKSSPAPDLGPQRYTIHAAGTLVDVLEELTKLTGWPLWPVPPSGPGGQPGKAITERPVSIDFSNATLGDILMSVCKQVGAVYEVPNYQYAAAELPPILIHPGDVHVDGRPSCYLDDYVLRVTDISTSASRSASFHWGTAEPSRRRRANHVQIGIEITARTRDAYYHMSGYTNNVRAVVDVGTPVGPKAPYYISPQRGAGARGLSQIAQVVLPPIDQGATMITRLEGELRLYSLAKATQLTIPANSEGKTFTKDGVSATVTQWKVQGDVLRATLQTTVPPLPGAPRRNGVPYAGGWEDAVLVATDGRRIPVASMLNPMSGEPEHPELNYSMSLKPMADAPPAWLPAPVVPKALVVTFVRCGLPDKTLPFVIKNIPLP